MVLNFFITNATLTNPKTGEDVHIIVSTKTDRFADIIRAIGTRRRAYPGYELFETW